jgi:hypothetical protein
MSGSHRGNRSKTKLALIAGGSGIAILFGAIGYGIVKQGVYSQDAADQTADYAEHAARQIQQPCIRLAAPEKAQCLAHEISEYELKIRDNRREYDDLVAQRKSALWTFIMGFAALIGMALSAIGVVLVKVTFDETRKTNRIALKEGARATRRAIASAAETEAALKIARASANASAKLVKVSQANSELQLRAYLDFDGVSIFHDELRDERGLLGICVAAVVKNFGHTPAAKVQFNAVFLGTGKGGKVAFKGETTDDTGSIAPTDHVTKRSWIGLTQADWNALKEREFTVTCEIVISYDDLFKKPHVLKSIFGSDGAGDMGFVLGSRVSD